MKVGRKSGVGGGGKIRPVIPGGGLSAVSHPSETSSPQPARSSLHCLCGSRV